MRALVLLTLFWLAAPSVAGAGACKTTEFEGTPITWCVVPRHGAELRLWLNDAAGLPFGTFDRIDAALAERGKRLGLAINAGMYHPDRAPVGLYVENGIELAPLVTRAGPGNFGLLPNGVFCLTPDAAAVVESRAFAASGLACEFATQSGPMLVIDGALHPRFLAGSDSVNIRNGVGARADGAEVVLAISDAPLNFHRFARFFRDVAGTPNALFLDGAVSKLHAPALGRSDAGAPMGPILGVALPRN